MGDDSEKPPNYIKNAFTVDSIGTTPNENRIFFVGILPAALGLTGRGMSLYLCLFPDDKHDIALLPGFVSAIFFGWFVQLSMRRAYQMKDRDRRIALIEKLRPIPTISVGLAVAGLLTTLVVWFLSTRNASETHRVLAGLAIVFPADGILPTPFSFAARRIGWLVNPR